jgi:hypothetical protein
MSSKGDGTSSESADAAEAATLLNPERILDSPGVARQMESLRSGLLGIRRQHEAGEQVVLLSSHNLMPVPATGGPVRTCAPAGGDSPRTRSLSQGDEDAIVESPVEATATVCPATVGAYLDRCKLYGTEPNSGVLVALRFRLAKMQPTKKFFCKDMLPLGDVFIKYPQAVHPPAPPHVPPTPLPAPSPAPTRAARRRWTTSWSST